MSYFDRPTSLVECRGCAWGGQGSELRQGEVFRELVEYDCPNCGERVLFVLFPTRAEVESAAASGVADAIAMLASVRRADQRWSRVVTSRAVPVSEPDELATGDIRCSLRLEDDEHNEPWLVLAANGLDVHRELAVWESTEPAHRLFTAMHSRYRDRLVEFDCEPAMLYLGGDRLSSAAELDGMVASLQRES